MSPYSLTMLKIPSFSTPELLMRTLVLNRTIRDLMEISDIDFLNSVRRCGHVRWFVMNHYKCRRILPSTNYNEFHRQIDPNLNPWRRLQYLDMPDPYDEAAWESEKEVLVQYYNNYLIERWNYLHYSYPQIDYYTFD